MDVEYDLEKDAANLAKHGMSLALDALVLENRIGEIVDDRRDYGEVRIMRSASSRDGCSSAPIRCAVELTG